MITASGVECLRDPFVLWDNGVYYMYGTGWECYRSADGTLTGDWQYVGKVAEDPPHTQKDRWSPEVYRWMGGFYMFTTYFSAETQHRGCTVMRADSPEGPFREISDGHVTPREWDAIDGTLYVDPEGQPWMVFVHEWTSMPDHVGTFAAARLSQDLTRLISEPIELFAAKDPEWARNGVTDGCFLYTARDGQLLMLWSNFNEDGYCVAIARSDNGRLDGHWSHDRELLYCKARTGMYDGGHGMLFTDPNGQMYLSFHSPNRKVGERRERPVFLAVREDNGTIVWDE